MSLYNKTVKIWLFQDTGNIHYPSPMFISLGCASGHKPGLWALETSYIPHNHTLTVYYKLQWEGQGRILAGDEADELRDTLLHTLLGILGNLKNNIGKL